MLDKTLVFGGHIRTGSFVLSMSLQGGVMYNYTHAVNFLSPAKALVLRLLGARILNHI